MPYKKFIIETKGIFIISIPSVRIQLCHLDQEKKGKKYMTKYEKNGQKLTSPFF